MPLAWAARAHRFERGRDHAHEGHRLHFEFEFAADDAGGVEQVLDQLQLHPSVALDDLHSLFDLRRVRRARTKQPRVTEDRIERAAQLVRHHRQEFVF